MIIRRIVSRQKGTIFSAILNEAHEKREDPILTIEDPLEFKHEHKGCLICHNKVKTH